MSEDYKELCRLCLESNPEFSIYEDKIAVKIGTLLTVEIDPEPSDFPSKICRTCRINLEKLHIFRLQSLAVDSKLREALYGSETIKDRCDDSISFLKQHDSDFNEHDYGDKNAKLRKNSTTSDDEYASIEKTVQQALHQNNYYGTFVLKIEEIEGNGLRKVRVIKDNGANIIMKIRMPESFLAKKQENKKPSQKTDSLKLILEKCESLENGQEKISRSVLQTEKQISQILQKSKFGIEFVDTATSPPEKDETAPFELPISSLSELWRLNARITDSEVREAMNLELLKVEPLPGIKIIGRVVRSVIDKALLGQLCWSGRIKVDHKYMKIDDKMMLSRMKNIVTYLLEVCQSKEDTPNNVFLATVMNILRKARFKVKDTHYTDLLELKEEYLNEDEFANDIAEDSEID